jgi:tetratricopeptide (TPR) repeat protein
MRCGNRSRFASVQVVPARRCSRRFADARTDAVDRLPVRYLVAAGVALRAQRFDDIVRADFFAGMSGDVARFDHAMQTCEDALMSNPKNASALVWHGAGLLVRSGVAFRAGKADDGLELRIRAMREMNEAVAMTPEDVQVLMPRAAILVSSARFSPNEQARDMARIAAADYEKVLVIEAPYASRIGTHGRGELLGGLATAYRLLGDTEKATSYLERISKELPGTAYDQKAQRWLADLSAVPKEDRFCLGCHVK